MTTATIVKVACPACGDELDPGYLCNTAYEEGDPIKVCDACKETEYRECRRCNRHVSKTEAWGDYHGHLCDECWEKGRWYAWG